MSVQVVPPIISAPAASAFRKDGFSAASTFVHKLSEHLLHSDRRTACCPFKEPLFLHRAAFAPLPLTSVCWQELDGTFFI